MQQLKRAPARRCRIAEINPEKDIRVRVLGKVIDKAEDVIIIDDGTGKMEVVAENPDVEIGHNAFIFARILPLENGYEARAEMIRPAAELDVETYRKVFG